METCLGFLAAGGLALRLPFLGPDLAQPDFDRAEALARLAKAGPETIEATLLNQRVIAGIGNVFKSEVLFLAAIDPLTPTDDLRPEQLESLLDIARERWCATTPGGGDALAAGPELSSSALRRGSGGRLPSCG